jgi:hypothetical protein
MRNSMDAQEVAVGWWPGDARYGRAAYYGYAHPAPDGFAGAELPVEGARWEGEMGLYLLDDAGVDHAAPLAFARALLRHACVVCDWDPALLASAEGSPPPVT